MTPAQAAAKVQHVIAVVNTWHTHSEGVGISQSDTKILAQQIDGDYFMNQLQGFDEEKYKSASAIWTQKSPFKV